MSKKTPHDAPPPKRRPGRPRKGPTKAQVSINFDLDVLAWLAQQLDEDGQLAPLVNERMRELMKLEQSGQLAELKVKPRK